MCSRFAARAKTWLLRYRGPGTGKDNFLSLGSYPDVDESVQNGGDRFRQAATAQCKVAQSNSHERDQDVMILIVLFGIERVDPVPVGGQQSPPQRCNALPIHRVQVALGIPLHERGQRRFHGIPVLRAIVL